MSNKNLKTRILNKWNEQLYGDTFSTGMFIRFKNGNSLDCRVSNLQYVTPIIALSNLDWKVDWDCELTKREKKYVLENSSEFINYFLTKIDT